MRRPRSISNIAWSAVMTIALSNCTAQPRSTSASDEASRQSALELKLDPLGLPQDTVIVVTPNSPAEKKMVEELRLSRPIIPQQNAGALSVVDSATSQVYRVQLLTADSYSDARRALAVAEEIFDLSVSLTYDQPYYKLRVGGFVTKSDADAYLLKAKAAGYANCWVLLTTVGVKELKPMYESVSPTKPIDTAKNTHDKHD